MCLAAPVKIIEIDGKIGVVEAGGNTQRVNISLITEPKVGDFVLLHAGFAIEKWSLKDVEEFNKLMQEINDVADR